MTDFNYFKSMLQGYNGINFGEYEEENHSDPELTTRNKVSDLNDAQVIGSETPYGFHLVALDLDLQAALVPSSTPGHYHLYIEKYLSWEQYEKLLTVMGDVGILNPGFVKLSLKRKQTFLRLPWVKKTVSQ